MIDPPIRATDLPEAELHDPDPGIERLDAGAETAATTIASDLAAREIDSISGKRFGTWSGVIRPTVLTILGVMMYLREGWLVGNAGLGGALLIILMCYAITGATALSLSSITTNIRLGAGGVFSIATQSLGLEVGGSIGIPFYLAQSLSVAMYVYGFMEGWRAIFPDHHPTLVVLAVFAVIFLVSYLSTSLAFRVQVLVMTGVIVALGSIFLGLRSVPEIHTPQILGSFENASFWTLFAIFFPAATGIMVGASMSGNLENPRRSIPLGTMTAWGVSGVVYVALAVWYAVVATPDELRGNLTIAIDRAFWGPGVLIGILSSCFTAALSSFVASPRTLQALGKHQIVPGSSFFSKLHRGEPRNAVLFTGALVVVILLLGDLNTIAQVVTVFFLMTYFTLNFILVIEKKLNLISFRPLFKVPIAVPLAGSFACLAAIVVVAPFLGLVCILVSVAIYVYLDRRALDAPYETLNSGLLISLADWAATKVARSTDTRRLRSWRPDVLVPIERLTQLEGHFRLLLALTHPQGSIQVIGIRPEAQSRALRGIDKLVNEIRGEGLFASSAVIESADFVGSLRTAAAVMKSSVFRPNILFASIEDRSQQELESMLTIAEAHDLGVVFLAHHKETHLGLRRRVNLWISDQSPDWHLSFKMANIDLPLLLTLMLIRNWKMSLTVISLVRDPEQNANARSYLRDLMVLARMPPGYSIEVENTPFREYLRNAPRADLNVFGLARTVSREFTDIAVRDSESSCLFVRDSGGESVLV